jgi:hypothetical protein
MIRQHVVRVTWLVDGSVVTVAGGCSTARSAALSAVCISPAFFFVSFSGKKGIKNDPSADQYKNLVAVMCKQCKLVA